MAVSLLPSDACFVRDSVKEVDERQLPQNHQHRQRANRVGLAFRRMSERRRRIVHVRCETLPERVDAKAYT